MDDITNHVQFVDPFTVLVINAKGYMRQVYTPFRVQTILPAGQIPVNAWVYVDGVWQDKKDRLLYLVGGKLYPYWCFRLQILF
jgi:hypothetical protein